MRFVILISLFVSNLICAYESVGYKRHFNLPLFSSLKSSKAPDWMLDQIHKDFQPFYSTGISLFDIDKLYEHLTNDFPHTMSYIFLRFRIINGKIYLHRPSEFFRDNYINYKDLFTLLRESSDLPNVDLIMHYSDATPCENLQDSCFWLTEEERSHQSPRAPLLTYGKLKDPLLSLGLVIIPNCNTVHGLNSTAARAQKASQQAPWKTKANQAIWRGAITDLRIDPSPLSPLEVFNVYKSRPRFKVCELSSQFPDLIDAGFSSLGGYDILEPFLRDKTKGYMDTSLQIRYKYQINLDGWGWPSNFAWGIASNCLCFKQEEGINDWFYTAFTPYQHYIPVKKDLSDLCPLIQWARNHDKECQQMAQNASSLFATQVTNEYALLYFYLVLKEYQRLQQFDLSLKREETENNPDWVLLE